MQCKVENRQRAYYRCTQEVFALSKPRRFSDPKLDDALSALVAHYTPGSKDKRRAKLLRTLFLEAIAMVDDDIDTGDLKLVATAFSEIRDALERFGPYKDRPKVTVFGSARSPRESQDYALAEHFSRKIADAGFMVITGAGPGIMEAGNRGAGAERSFGVNIKLPFEQAANEVIHDDVKLAEFKYFFTRKLFFVKEAAAIVMFPGGYGTHDEMFECLTLVQTGKAQMMPIIALDVPRGTFWKTWDRYVREHLLRKGLISENDLDLYTVTDNVDAAVREIRTFYSNYHSSRAVRDKLVIRIHEKLSRPQLRRLSADFSDILDNQEIVQRGPLRDEADEPELSQLPRLVLSFNRAGYGKSYGRLRRLIDAVNQN